MGSRIIGVGKAQPQMRVTNDDMAKIVDTSDEWIVTRTGISARRLATTETTCDLAAAAARVALCHAKVAPADIDLIVFATITPDATIPSAAAALKAALGCSAAVAFDINAACSGTVFALTVANAMMAAGAVRAQNRPARALVIGAERLSRLVDWTDRSTCVLFGDGAGAVVLEAAAANEGIQTTFIANEDDTTQALSCPTTYAATNPFKSEGEGDPTPSPSPYIHMDGQRVFKFAGRVMEAAVREVCSRAGIELADVDLIVPHQANERIIKFAAKRLGLDLSKFEVAMQETGNTSSASIPMALADAYAQNKINPGDKVVLVGFGAGLTYGAILYIA